MSQAKPEARSVQGRTNREKRIEAECVRTRTWRSWGRTAADFDQFCFFRFPTASLSLSPRRYLQWRLRDESEASEAKEIWEEGKPLAGADIWQAPSGAHRSYGCPPTYLLGKLF